MTRAQFIILARLEHQPGMSQNELAAIAGVAPITVARLVDRLEAQGLVERCTDPKDRRIWRLRLTRAAAPVLRDIKRYRAEVRALMTKGQPCGLESDGRRPTQDEGKPEQQPRRSGGVKQRQACALVPG
jgi:DNA-binding MarR family transcriptional regulator